MILVIHSRHDKESREFVETLPSEYMVVDFYDYESSERKLLNEVKQTISDFPSVVDTEQNLLVLKPSNIEDALSVFNQARSNKANRDFLKDTDWYVVRFLETEVPIPTKISEAREAARNSIVE